MPKVKKPAPGARGKGPIEKPTSSKKLRAAKSSNTTETSVDDEQVSIAADVSGASLAAASDADSDDSAQGGDHPPSYLFHCAMTCSDDPMITRVLSIPSNFTFSRVHEVMQVAFGWAFSHLWTFEVLGLPGSGLVCDLPLSTESSLPFRNLCADKCIRTNIAVCCKYRNALRSS